MPILSVKRNITSPIAFFSDEVELVRMLRSDDPNIVKAMMTFSFDADVALQVGCVNALISISADAQPSARQPLSKSVVQQQIDYVSYSSGFISNYQRVPNPIFRTAVDITSRLDNTLLGRGQYRKLRHVVRPAAEYAAALYSRKKVQRQARPDAYANYLSSLTHFDASDPTYTAVNPTHLDERSFLLGSSNSYRRYLHPYQQAAARGTSISSFDEVVEYYPVIASEESQVVDVDFVATINRKLLTGTTAVITIEMRDKRGRTLQAITKTIDVNLMVRVLSPNLMSSPIVALSNAAEGRLAQVGRRVVVSSKQPQEIFYRTSPTGRFSKLPTQHVTPKFLKPNFKVLPLMSPSTPAIAKSQGSAAILHAAQQVAPKTVISVPDLAGYLEVRTLDDRGGYTSSKMVDVRAPKTDGFVHAYQESSIVTVRLYDVDLSPAASVRFYSRNVTVNSAPKPISRNIIVANTTDPRNLFATDKDFMPGHVYEYYAVVQARNGTSFSTAHDFIMTYSFLSKIFPVVYNKSITDQQGSSPNVTFDLTVSRPEQISNDLLNTLRRAGLEDYFKNDLSSNLDRFSELVSYNVHRYDVTTGERCDLGNVYDGNFDDVVQSKKRSAPLLSRGHSYLYEVRPSLSSPQIVMNSAVSQSTNVLLKSNYSVVKTKVSNSHTRLTGVMLPDIDTASKRFGVTPLELGMIGCTTLEQVYLPNDSVEVTDLVGQSFKISNLHYGVLLTWEVSSTQRAADLDHFVVYRRAGTNTLLGRSHAQGTKFSMSEEVKFSGDVTYTVQPVFVDGTLGQPNTVKLNLV